MGRVDDGVDPLSEEVGRKTLGAPKPANPHRDRDTRGIRGCAGKRENRRNLGLVSEAAREGVCLRGPAENKQARAFQWAAP
jgi:hypothetical protein